MRILMVSSVPHVVVGGVQAVVERLSAGVATAGHDVKLVTNDVHQRGQVAGHVQLPMVHPRTWHGVPTPASLYSVAQSILRTTNLLKAFDPDIVHVHYLDYPIWYWAKKRARRRYRLLVTSHGNEPADVGALQGQGARQQPCERNTLRRLWVSRALSRADMITAVSSELQDVILQLYGLRSRVIPNGIDMAYWTPGRGSERSTNQIAFVGRLSPEKGCMTLLSAMSLVRQADPSAHVLFAGAGPEEGRLRAYARDRGLSDCVRFAGPLGPPEVRELYRSSTILAMPSRSEGLPLVALEAMACGLPVIATGVGGIPSLISPSTDGLIVPVGDSGALAKAILMMLSNMSLRQAISASALSKVQGFSAQVMIERYCSAYTELLRGLT